MGVLPSATESAARKARKESKKKSKALALQHPKSWLSRIKPAKIFPKKPRNSAGSGPSKTAPEFKIPTTRGAQAPRGRRARGRAHSQAPEQARTNPIGRDPRADRAASRSTRPRNRRRSRLNRP
uniref:Uncharacterized protein n=1 Tax=Arundo donax TaxID=35708 RepID=A0A0A9HZY0_ARUDO